MLRKIRVGGNIDSRISTVDSRRSVRRQTTGSGNTGGSIRTLRCSSTLNSCFLALDSHIGNTRLTFRFFPICSLPLPFPPSQFSDERATAKPTRPSAAAVITQQPTSYRDFRRSSTREDNTRKIRKGTKPLYRPFVATVYGLCVTARPVGTASSFYMPRFPVAFGRRKSTATAEDFQDAQVAAGPSFRVLERSEVAGGKSFDGGARLSRAAGQMPRTTVTDLPMEENMFADLKSNRYGFSRSPYRYMPRSPLLWQPGHWNDGVIINTWVLTGLVSMSLTDSL
jgi:hypothetical protein